MPSKKNLTDLRAAIDKIDRRLLDLIAERASLCVAVGETKSQTDRGILDVGREKQVLAGIRKLNPGPLRDDAVEAVFRELISACRALQRQTTVGYLGPAGTYTHEAAVKQFGSSAMFDPCETIAEIFTAVETERATFGIVPVENTTEGAVTPTLDALAETSAKILAEVVLKIDHYLMARDGDQKKVRRIASHPQGLAQCRRYLAENFPGIELLPVASTAAAAKLAASERGTAAIGSRLACELNALQPVARSIQDNASNVTRFLVIGPDQKTRPSGRDRTSLVVTVKDRVGILERIIRQFSRNKVNLSMIESRPLVGRSWEYRFFVDVTGHAVDEPVAKALASLERIALSVKVLGSYPIAT
ncbi:MAG TPA: prephenate dehydratase [Candidatus Binatia bacterium]|nr:prephenate dehydratase [Candidatus Binatia bacterium]